MGTKLEDLPPHLRKQVEQQLAAPAKGRDTRKDAEPEHHPHQALEKRPQAAEIGERVYLVVLCYRTGIRWDIDNVSIKPFLDGLVERGILEDDSTKQIEGIVKLCRTVKTKDEERTELEFWNADYFGKFIEAARQGGTHGSKEDSSEEGPGQEEGREGNHQEIRS